MYHILLKNKDKALLVKEIKYYKDFDEVEIIEIGTGKIIYKSEFNKKKVKEIKDIYGL